jgi:hypothetical protein
MFLSGCGRVVKDSGQGRGRSTELRRSLIQDMSGNVKAYLTDTVLETYSNVPMSNRRSRICLAAACSSTALYYQPGGSVH